MLQLALRPASVFGNCSSVTSLLLRKALSWHVQSLLGPSDALDPLPAPLPPACCHAVSSGSGVTVRCERPSTGWATFTLTLGTSTTTPDVANCGDTKSEQVTVQAYVKPAVTVSSDSAPGVCSESLNSDSTWTVSRDTEGTLDVTLEVTCTPTACTPNLECRLKDSSGNPITGG